MSLNFYWLTFPNFWRSWQSYCLNSNASATIKFQTYSDLQINDLTANNSCSVGDKPRIQPLENSNLKHAAETFTNRQNSSNHTSPWKDYHQRVPSSVVRIKPSIKALLRFNQISLRGVQKPHITGGSRARHFGLCHTIRTVPWASGRRHRRRRCFVIVIARYRRLKGCRWQRTPADEKRDAAYTACPRIGLQRRGIFLVLIYRKYLFFSKPWN